MTRPETDGARGGVSSTWSAFLAMVFLVVGLAGMFASYAVPLPLERALARDATLDAAMVAARGPNPAAALEALRPQLGESAEVLLPPGTDIEQKIAAERSAMHARLLAESDEVATRTHCLLAVITVMGAVFGVAILHIGRRG